VPDSIGSFPNNQEKKYLVTGKATESGTNI